MLTPTALQWGKAWAAGDVIHPDNQATLVRVARLLYPHDGLSDDVYQEALVHALDYVANSEEFSQLLKYAEEQLDNIQKVPFLALDEQTQINTLMCIQEKSFFEEILNAVTTALYMHPAVWSMIGYEGPSYMYGGYLHRGAGVIEWLEDA
jgi:hypothetical protein